jgi:Flp pilus assembly protein TadD
MNIKGRKKRKDAAAAADRGLKLLAEHRHEEAYGFLREAVQQFPEEPEIRMHYAHSLLAVRPEDAVSEVKKAIDLSPDDPVRLTRAAGILFGMGHVDTASSYATRARELAPPNFPFMSDLTHLDGHFATREGNYELAEERFRSALEHEPTNEIFAADFARFLSEQGRRSEALAIVEEAVARTERKEPLERLRDELLNQADPLGDQN